MLKNRLVLVVAAFVAAIVATLAAVALVPAQPPIGPTPPAIAPRPPTRQTLTFVTHAAFFSTETRRSPVIDPQVFVKDDAVSEGTGPQNIAHLAGFRPARADDVPEAVLYNANGDSLGFTLGKWLGVSGAAPGGTVEIVPTPAAGARLTMSFKRLIAFGLYSVFRVTFSPDGTTFLPIDGDGTTNTFTTSIDGSASTTVTTPSPLTHANAIVLVLHSDGQEHGISRGVIGLTAHHQLIAKIP